MKENVSNNDVCVEIYISCPNSEQYKFNVIKNWHGFLYFLYKSIPIKIRTFDVK